MKRILMSLCLAVLSMSSLSAQQYAKEDATNFLVALNTKFQSMRSAISQLHASVAAATEKTYKENERYIKSVHDDIEIAIEEAPEVNILGEDGAVAYQAYLDYIKRLKNLTASNYDSYLMNVVDKSSRAQANEERLLANLKEIEEPVEAAIKTLADLYGIDESEYHYEN